MTTTVRIARRDDAPDFLALVEALARYEKLTPPDADAEARLTEDAFGDNPRIRVLLAHHEGKAIGYAILCETYSSFLARPTLYLEDLYVDPQARRAQAGTALLRAIAHEARARGCHRIEGVVLGWNEPAQAFYRATGGQVHDDWWLIRYDRAAIERHAP